MAPKLFVGNLRFTPRCKIEFLSALMARRKAHSASSMMSRWALALVAAGTLLLPGATRDGTTTFGGFNYNNTVGLSGGTIFKVNTDGSGYEVLHFFTNPPTDGYRPTCSLVLSNGKLYGTTSGYDGGGYSTLFSMNTDGSGYAVLHSFIANGEVLWLWGSLT